MTLRRSNLSLIDGVSGPRVGTERAAQSSAGASGRYASLMAFHFPDRKRQ